MRRLLVGIVLCISLACQVNAQDLKKVYDETIDPIAQIDKAVKDAKASGKFVVCQVGGNWCPWCLRFADFITNDSIVNKTIEDNYVYIHVNFTRKSSDAKVKEMGEKVMKRLDNCGRFGFPVLVVLDSEGKIIHIQDSGYLEEGKSYNHRKVLKFFKNWTPKAVGA